MVALLAFGAACDPDPLPLCGTIPEDGCPVGRGGTCEDPYCAALYDCVDAKWQLAETCGPIGGGGAGGESPVVTGTGGCSGGVMFDHTMEATDCTPDLQSPDCPAAAAEGCGTPCLTSCLDFYLCTDAGWDLVAYCSEGDNELVIVQGAP